VHPIHLAQQVYCWGAVDWNENTVLHARHEKASASLRLSKPTLIPLDYGLRISKVACGLRHTVLLTPQGTVLTFGNGDRCRLGSITENIHVPRVVKFPRPSIRFVDVACGDHHTALVTSTGEAWTYGVGTEGQLGRLALSPSGSSSADRGLKPAQVTQSRPMCCLLRRVGATTTTCRRRRHHHHHNDQVTLRLHSSDHFSLSSTTTTTYISTISSVSLVVFCFVFGFNTHTPNAVRR
jgi:hypothetical protein